MPDEVVADDELLLRRVRREWAVIREGRWQLTSQAFNDSGMKPSVDRRMLRQSPQETQHDPSDGVIELLTGQVRGITEVIQNPGAPDAERKPYFVDVLARPIPANNAAGLTPNPAHAQVEVSPEFASRSRFNKLKDALCRLAVLRPWAIEPTPPPTP